MSGEPWFRFFPSDWLSGVSELTAAERGVYMTLLAIMYDHGDAIERDDARLSRQCGLPKVGFARALDGLVSTGKILVENGRLTNSRVKIELSERENRTRTASNNAQTRWQKPQQNQHQSDAQAMQTQCKTHASRAPVPQPQDRGKPLSKEPFPKGKGVLPLDEPKSDVVFLTAKQELWAKGPELLTALGVSSNKARTLIGHWLRDTGDDSAMVLDVIKRAAQQKPFDPIPWITRGLVGSRPAKDQPSRYMQTA